MGLGPIGVPAFNPATLRVGKLPVFIAGDVDGLRLLMGEAADAGRIAASYALHPQVKYDWLPQEAYLSFDWLRRRNHL